MDCSITKRKGCNYCLRGKDFGGIFYNLKINEKANVLIIKYDDEDLVESETEAFCINYCPCCGKKL